jgi:BirA family transcriptional regulator, biotin operon repressor / biotin---[acetyl-CoA-carboxylase] ligase
VPDSTLDINAVLAKTFVARAEHHPTLGSTNDRARACIGDRGPLPLLIVADRQTAGRGRGTNRWWTGAGSLAFSLLLPPNMLPADPRRGPLVALATGVAVVEAVRPLVGDAALGIYWPNDVMVADRKLAGILVEATPDRSHIVGIGINTNNTTTDAPAEIRDRIVTLADLTDCIQNTTAILIDILRHFERALAQLPTKPEDLASRANAMCLQIGRTLTICVGNESATGRCAGIGPDGALLIDTADARREYRSGTLH